ncbi:hypothetical protein QFC22_002194 [Naganishia vaughanmartiniae]|uniref:Uncharacterized protein n=1 Tax=Naganishia vaughanmartiniae TaxID=1424756 RepID=A0ACC2XDX6_9TREE|nr:hypothetical protein QFC22_002194 [Naganishia vaughanmartiniae]
MATASQGEKKVVIIGAGIFGVSTALWMYKRGGYSVTILDKAQTLPAPDAASTDINKIIRSGDYADPTIAALNVDAVNEWRKPEWEGTYHESGVVMTAECGSAGNAYVESSYKNVCDNGIPAMHCKTSAEIRKAWPAKFRGEDAVSTLTNAVSTVTHLASPSTTRRLGQFHNRTAYLNPHSGWAEAGRAVEVGLRRIANEYGGVIRAGCEVVGLVEERGGDGKSVVQGVQLASGEQVLGDIVIVATGAWTPALFAQDGMEQLPQVIATGQSVAKVQLTPEEAQIYSGNPVIFDMKSGFYVFPPTPENIVKCAIHDKGVTYQAEQPNPNCRNDEASAKTGVSVPRTILTPGGEAGCIPLEMLRKLRHHLAEVYPELGKRDFIATRLCWYLDTPDGDWLIDWHPKKQNLLFATAGCGHAFKFLPNIGREIVNKIEGTLAPALDNKWRFEGRNHARDASTDSDLRGNEGHARVAIKVEDLATSHDLKADRFAAPQKIGNHSRESRL